MGILNFLFSGFVFLVGFFCGAFVTISLMICSGDRKGGG